MKNVRIGEKSGIFLLCDHDFCKHLEVLLQHCSELNLIKLPSVLVLGGSISATNNLSILPSSTPLPSHLPHGNLQSYHRYKFIERFSLKSACTNYSFSHSIPFDTDNVR
jgi:hypothetical protein